MEKAGIPQDFLKKIMAQAEAEYPKEACGVITGGPEDYRRLRPFRNVQDEYHAQDPVNFPRTSKNAYWIEPRELLNLQKEMRTAGEEIRIIYHSHPDAGAYFSQEDTRMALLDGRPAYPGVKYMVISVMAGKAADMCLYEWNEAREEFLVCA